MLKRLWKEFWAWFVRFGHSLLSFHRSVNITFGIHLKVFPYVDLPTRTVYLGCSCGRDFYRDVRTKKEADWLATELYNIKQRGWINKTSRQPLTDDDKLLIKWILQGVAMLVGIACFVAFMLIFNGYWVRMFDIWLSIW